MRKILFSAVTLALFVLGFTASNVDEPTPTPTPDIPSTGTEGIIKITSQIEGWNSAFVTPLGYFCYDKELGETKSSQYSALTFMTPDEKDYACLVANMTDNRPTQLITTCGNLYFSFPNDSILELLYDNGNKMEMIDSIPYNRLTLPGIADFKGDDLKGVIANAALLLKRNQGSISNPQLAQLIPSLYGIFEQVCNLNYESDDEYLATLPKDINGNYMFASRIRQWFNSNVTDMVKDVISLWTGKATYKVGGSSCTLAASIFCSSDAYNNYGTYGIVCDTDPAKLKSGIAEYEGTGHQGKDQISYEVDFRGFKPNTTYYYTAFYKFNTSDHGGLVAKYGDSNAEVIYDTTIKSFTTGDNILTVDVVMCIDVTGSMSGIINTVKRNAIDFYDQFKKCCDDEGITLADLNAQVIAFRDKNVDYEWLETSPTYILPGQKDDYNKFVNSLYADGGGDIAESGLEALQSAFNKTDWGVDDGYHRQVVILWTDAPYLLPPFSDITLDNLHGMWNSLPSGRRLVLFAPYGTDYNGGSWGELDGWKNLIHEDDLYNGFNNFEYILKSIIGELTSKGVPSRKAAPRAQTIFTPN